MIKRKTLACLKKSASRPSSPDDVRGYCLEKGCTHVDAEKFVDTFSAKGWRVGETNTP